MWNFLKKLAGKENNELATFLKSGAFLVDVRSAAEFKFGSVKGAVNIPLEQIVAKAPMLKTKKAIVVFCRSGARSSQAKRMLERSGVTNIVNGGSWQQVQRNLSVNP